MLTFNLQRLIDQVLPPKHYVIGEGLHAARGVSSIPPPGSKIYKRESDAKAALTRQYKAGIAR